MEVTASVHSEYVVGQKVMLRKKRLLKKEDENWSGPYDISECFEGKVYRLKKLKGKYESTRLKPYHAHQRGKFSNLKRALLQ